MIDRYTRPRMGEIFSDQTKFGHWLVIEVLVCEARAARGEIPLEDLATIKERASFDAERIADLERKTRHDVAAFVDNVAESIGPASRHLHYGMTSSDLIDTALALALRDAAGELLTGLGALIRVVVRLARDHAMTVMVARTHGIHAEPTTFGLKAAGWAWELARGKHRLDRARGGIAVGKLSGAVGTYSQLAPEIEDSVCRSLGLEPDPASTQVVSRDRHAEFASALGILAGSVERVATEIRHLARTEVREVEEPFAEGEQKGSSAMPHKRNPWRSERLCGLARIVRSAYVPAVENIALWHERDISHSSVERVLLPDACITLDFMIAETTEILEGLLVYPERMRSNFDHSFGLVFSQRVLLALIDSGWSRDEAYRVVQELAIEAWRSGRHLRDLMTESGSVTQQLSPSQIESCFDESRYLEHAESVIRRLTRLETE